MKERNYILGLDLGVASVGWSCLEVDKKQEPFKIIQAGCRIFPAENGDMAERRTARSLRRLIRRKKGRLNKIKSLFVNYNYMQRENLKNFNETHAHQYASPYELKVKGLHEELTMDELYICLLHYAKYRGFKSNRKNKEEAKNTKNATEDQKLLFSIENTQKVLEEHQYTISQYIINDARFKQKIKNTTNDFKIGITRKMIQDEAEMILDKQIEFGLINEDFKNEYMNNLLYQRSFSEGPNEPSPYHDPLKKMIGVCKFDNNDRAPLSAPSFEKFILLQKLTDLRYYITNPRDTNSLTKEQISQIVQKAMKGKIITYKIVQEEIGENVKFKGLTLLRSEYIKCLNSSKENPDKTLNEICDEHKLKTVIYEMKMTKFLNKSLKKLGFVDVDILILDEIADLFSKFKSDDEIKNNIEQYNHLMNQDDIFKKAILEIDESSFKTFGKLSFQIIYKIVPDMLNGLDYTNALKKNGYDHTNRRKRDEDIDALPPMVDALEELNETITNKAVIATLNETKNLINAILVKYGKPKAIHVEVARELTKSKLEREQILEKQMNNKMNKIEIKMQMLNKYPHVFNSIQKIHHDDIVKYRLYFEQGGIDPYTLACTNDESSSHIPEKDLFSEEYEVDHIIPYSISLNDAISNKILVHAKMNREKSNKIPMQAFKGKEGMPKYIEFIKNIRDPQKREYLLLNHITEEMQNGFSARALNDTRYATKTLCTILNYYFPNINIKSFTGQITAKLKGVWGLNNITHSYQNGAYILKEEYDEELEKMYHEVDVLASNDMHDDAVKVLKKNIVKKEKEREKKNRGNHLHHALDATIIASATDSLRRRIEIHEQFLRLHTNEVSTVKVPKYNHKTGEFLEYEIIDNVCKNFDTYFDLTKNMSDKYFPLPYESFREEVILRVYERNEKVLRDSLCTNTVYTDEDRKNVLPLMVSHKFSKKENGRLHEATIKGVAPNPDNYEEVVLTSRIPINSTAFKVEKLEKIYDKDKTQHQIYLAVKEWLGNHKDGSVAFEKNDKKFPKSNNGNEIKKVKLALDAPKEEICIHEEKQQYVAKENVIQIHVYKKEDSDSLYFIGMDRYRVMNYKKDPNIMLWWGQGSNCCKLKYSDLSKQGYTLYQKLYKNQIIHIELKNGGRGIARVIGFASGMLEVGSVIGDNYDLIYYELQSKIKNRQQITISTIKSIKPISVNVLGDFS